MVKSLLQRNKACYICGTTLNLHTHHVFFGYSSKNRDYSDADGCVVYLCLYHHTGAQGVHNNRKLDLTLKARCQIEWQKHYSKTTEDFIKRYGKSYL